MAIFAGIVLTLFVAWLTLAPFFDQSFVDDDSTANSLSESQDRKERLLRMLSDLELDFATGKLSNEDFNGMRIELKSELSKLQASGLK